MMHDNYGLVLLNIKLCVLLTVDWNRRGHRRIWL